MGTGMCLPVRAKLATTYYPALPSLVVRRRRHYQSLTYRLSMNFTVLCNSVLLQEWAQAFVSQLERGSLINTTPPYPHSSCADSATTNFCKIDFR